MPVEGVIDGVGDDRSLVSSLDKTEVVLVGVGESRWRHLMVLAVFEIVEIDEKHHWTCVDGD